MDARNGTGLSSLHVTWKSDFLGSQAAPNHPQCQKWIHLGIAPNRHFTVAESLGWGLQENAASRSITGLLPFLRFQWLL